MTATEVSETFPLQLNTSTTFSKGSQSQQGALHLLHSEVN